MFYQIELLEFFHAGNINIVFQKQTLVCGGVVFEMDCFV